MYAVRMYAATRVKSVFSANIRRSPPAFQLTLPIGHIGGMGGVWDGQPRVNGSIN